MTKYLSIPTTQTNDMYGYPAFLFSMTESNFAEVKRLKEVFEKAKKLDDNISELTFYTHSLDFQVTNEYIENLKDFDEDNLKILDIDDADFDAFTDVSDNSYRVESSFIKVFELGITFVQNSKHTSDEVYATIGYKSLTEF